MYSWRNQLRLGALAAAAWAVPALAAPSSSLTVRLDGGANAPIAIGGADPTISVETNVKRGLAAAFEVTVTNSGSSDATHVLLNAILPDGTALFTAGPACDGGDQGDSGFPCALGTIAAGQSQSVGFSVTWPFPATIPSTCPTNLDLQLVATSDTSTDAGLTFPGLTVPLAQLSATASGPDGFLPDGGEPPTLLNPGDAVTFAGTLTNGGPCSVPAGSILIDTSPDDQSTLTSGLNYVSGAGDCAAWSAASAAPNEGQCTYPSVLAPNAAINFSTDWTVLPLAAKDAGGDSIIQSAVVLNYAVSYNGNLLPLAACSASGACTSSPTSTSLVKGPAAACNISGSGFPAAVLLASVVGLALRPRRGSKRHS